MRQGPFSTKQTTCRQRIAFSGPSASSTVRQQQPLNSIAVILHVTNLEISISITNTHRLANAHSKYRNFIVHFQKSRLTVVLNNYRNMFTCVSGTSPPWRQPHHRSLRSRWCITKRHVTKDTQSHYHTNSLQASYQP